MKKIKYKNETEFRNGTFKVRKIVLENIKDMSYDELNDISVIVEKELNNR